MENTGELSSKAIALQHVAGAYWRGDEVVSLSPVTL